MMNVIGVRIQNVGLNVAMPTITTVTMQSYEEDLVNGHLCNLGWAFVKGCPHRGKEEVPCRVAGGGLTSGSQPPPA